MKKIIFLFILLYTQLFFSQNQEEKDNNFCVSTNPLSLIDVYGSYSYRIGLETKIYRNIAFSTEVGNYFNYGKKDGIRLNSKGYIIKPEIKFYLNNNNLTSGEYVSLEYMYKDISFDWKDTIPTIENPNRVKEYRISKNIYSFTTKIGMLKIYQNNFIFDYFFGIGIRISNGSNSLTTDEQNEIRAYDESQIKQAQKKLNYILPNFTIGFRIGYKFY